MTITRATNIYLVHLALGDFLYLCLSAVFEIWKFTVTPVVFDFPIHSRAGFTCFWAVANTGYYAAIALVTMVSLERYLALCHPIKHLKIRSRQRTNRMVAICWLVGLIFAGLLAPHYTRLNVKCLQWPDNDAYQGFPAKIVQYHFSDISIPFIHFWNYYIQPLQHIPWVIAMIGNIYMYVQMIRALNKRRRINGTDKHQKALQVRNQVAKMLIVNGIVFFICQTPYNVIALSRWVSFVADVPNPVTTTLGNIEDLVVSIPILINNIVNPLIYGAMSTQYREAFVKAFQLKRRHGECSTKSAGGHVATRGSKTATEINRVEFEVANETRL